MSNGPHPNCGARAVFPLVVRGALAIAALGLFGCEDGIPQVQTAQDLVIPGLDVERSASRLRNPLTVDETSEQEVDDSCVTWVKDEEASYYNASSGEYYYLFTCAEGGSIEYYTVEGLDNQDGTGQYTQTQFGRDGRTVTWHYEYTYSLDGLERTYEGFSSQGESYTGTATTSLQGEESVEEQWVLEDGVYTNIGVINLEGIFLGEQSFDDPSTMQSPDWRAITAEDENGNYVQSVNRHEADTYQAYVYTLHTDGTSQYSFSSDVLATLAEPDFEGVYDYETDGSGTGTYLQTFDDGSTNLVSDVFAGDGFLTESWVFDDAATERDVDQEGELVYDLTQTSAEGTVTWHLADGASQTCILTVDASGGTALSDCSAL